MASASIAARAARERRAQASIRRRVLRPSPGSADLAVDEQCARPDARRPELLLPIRARNEQLTLVFRRAGSRHRRSAAAAPPRRPSRRRASPARPPRAATRRRAVTEPATAIPRATRTRRARARREIPAQRANLGGRRPEDVEVAPSELATRVGWVDLRGGDRPDGRSTRAVPANRDRARGRGVPDGVPRPSASPSSRSSCRLPSSWACTCSAMLLGAEPALGIVGKPREREEREVVLRDDIGACTEGPRAA